MQSGSSSTDHVVVDAARRCFGRYGYRKTSMDDVASAAGVAKGTVYLYCTNKQDLYVRAIESDVREWMGELAGALGDTDRSATEIMLEMAARDARFGERHPLAAELLTGSAHLHVPAATDRLAELRALGLSQVVAVLRLGIEQGEFRADLDVEPTAVVLQEMHLAATVLHRRPDLSMAEVRRRQVAAFTLVLHGLAIRNEEGR